jgi:hypothetical protein
MNPEEIRSTLSRLEEHLGAGNARDSGNPLAYILLVGGDDIVPFHPVLDPSEDQDEFVLSDHPYACTDSSHLAFERAVGRLPDEASDDPSYLLRLITVATEAHRRRRRRSPGQRNSVCQTLEGWLGRAHTNGATTSFGYSASIWRQAAREVFSFIGQASQLRTSPPLTSQTMPALGPISPRFLYFNLHGLQDSVYWYGHRHPRYKADYPLFPVALTPDNIPAVSDPRAVVFSEACYGAYTIDKEQMSSLALHFLAAQALGMVGSTALAYGGIGIPLVGADLLARAFWERVKVGHPLGEALRQAKQALVQEMLARQGYLDPEDEKALLSFVLYGDPTLVIPARVGDENVKTTSETAPERESLSGWAVPDLQSSPALSALGSTEGDTTGPARLCRQPVREAGLVPSELVTRVQHQLASSLPSSMWADVSVSAQVRCREARRNGSCSLCRALAPDQSSAAVGATQSSKATGQWLPARAELVFTLQERSGVLSEGAGRTAVHHQVAKVTVDGEGRLVKVAISR